MILPLSLGFAGAAAFHVLAWAWRRWVRPRPSAAELFTRVVADAERRVAELYEPASPASGAAGSSGPGGTGSIWGSRPFSPASSKAIGRSSIHASSRADRCAAKFREGSR